MVKKHRKDFEKEESYFIASIKSDLEEWNNEERSIQSRLWYLIQASKTAHYLRTKFFHDYEIKED